jgi:hypothetical protein
MTEAPVRIPYRWSVPDERDAGRVQETGASDDREPHEGAMSSEVVS